MFSLPLVRSVLRFDTAKVRPWMGFRNTLATLLPLIVGAMLGSPAQGMVAGLGALNVAVADGTDPYAHRFRRMAATSLLCSMAVAVAILSGGLWFAPLILAGGAFVAGMLVAAGTAEADIGVIVLVTLITFSAQPAPPDKAFESALLALSGGLVQTLISLAFWPLRHRMPERRALSALYLELARAASETAPATEAPPSSQAMTDAQRTLSTLDARDNVDSERYLALLSQAERIRLSLLTLKRLHVRIGREPGTDAVIAILQHADDLASQALRRVGESLLEESVFAPSSEFLSELGSVGDQLRHTCRTCSEQASTMLNDARYRVDALGGQLRTVLDLCGQTTAAGLAEFEKREAAHPWKMQVAGTRSAVVANVLANLRLESATFRHALRLAVCIGAAQILGSSLHWRRPYWVPMTVALVLKPDFTTTFSRGLQRLLGTLLGLVLATALFHFLHPLLALQILFVALFTFLMRAYGGANYGLLAIGVTGLVVFLFEVAGISPGDVVLPRAMNTLVGGAIALLAYRLWPTWERTQVPEALAAMLEAYRDYFQAVRNGYLLPEESATAALDRTRLAARIARSQLEASIARMRVEPGNPAERIAAYDRILADSHRFIHTAMSLESGLFTSQPVPVRHEFHKFSNDVDFTLYYLSAALRGAAIEASHLPDLREDYHSLVEAGGANVPRYALVNIEADRIVNSLNTLSGEVLDVLKPPGGPTPAAAP